MVWLVPDGSTFSEARFCVECAPSGGRRSTREKPSGYGRASLVSDDVTLPARVGRVGGWGTPSYGRRRTPRRDRRWCGGECLAPAAQLRSCALSRAACRVRWSRSGRLGADRAASKPSPPACPVGAGRAGGLRGGQQLTRSRRTPGNHRRRSVDLPDRRRARLRGGEARDGGEASPTRR